MAIARRCATGDATIDPALIVEGDFRVESGYRAGLEILKKRPDAVFIANYLMSVGFMRALRQYQLRCPEDIAIVTCDDHPWLDSFSPRLTTVNLPKRELGAAAAPPARSSGSRSRRGAATRTIRLPSAMRIRESCGCAPSWRCNSGSRRSPDDTRCPHATPVRCAGDGAQLHRLVRPSDRRADHGVSRASTPTSAAVPRMSASAPGVSASALPCSPPSATTRSASS